MSAVRFTVTKAEGQNYGSVSSDDQSPLNAGGIQMEDPVSGGDTKLFSSKESDVLVMDQGQNTLDLYDEEFKQGLGISSVIGKLANYDGGTIPNTELEEVEGDDHTTSTKGKKKEKPKKDSKLGTILGVYFPCIQNIFGVILFVRVVWIVGVAGWLEGFFIVFIPCLCTMTTAISMSAIATNGVVPGGGSYFLISRALGPEFGGAVGILFYLGTSVASSMYIVGAVEIFLQYMCPMASIFGDVTIATNAANNYRVYGTILLIIMFIWVFLGVKFVSKFSPIALFCVIVSILCIYIGIFVARPSVGPRVCLLGDRLLTSDSLQLNGSMFCNKSDTGPMYQSYCGNLDPNMTDENNDPDCRYFNEHEAKMIPGIPGIASGVFMDNMLNQYGVQGDRVGMDMKGDRSKGEIVADITTSFVILLAIFFPSCTGIMAGSNRSGDLADASKSIPAGTIAAIATTSIVYLSCVLFFGATIEGHLLRDKFGESINGGLVVAELAWPNPWVILVGSLLSTIGAGLQSLTGAPRLLQAIASDGIIPFLNVFSVTTKSGEPLRALVLTAMISLIGVLIASLDYIAPIITMFFLMCYGFVNLACVLQSLLKTPNWRPRFKYYHWLHSLFGVILCIVIMFISSWYYALGALAIALFIYKYIEYKGAEKEWGDGIRGLAMSAARFALLKLEEGPPHVKNFRPQVLILLKLDAQLQPKHRKMLTFCSQLKAGKGLTLTASVLEGNYADRFADSQAAQQTVTQQLHKEKVKGFAEVLVSEDVVDGINHLIQTAGVGGLRHNTIMLGWPYGWRHAEDPKAYKVFIETLRIVSAAQMAVLIPKGIDQFPENSDKNKAGTIDIWWIVHDGGLLMLLPFLLTQHKVWAKCSMRIFTVAQMEDNSIQMKKDLLTFLYHLRLHAEVEVVEMPEHDISAYTYERTLMMEQRSTMLKEIKKNDTSGSLKIEKLEKEDPQAIIDKGDNIPQIVVGDSDDKAHHNNMNTTSGITIEIESDPASLNTSPEHAPADNFLSADAPTSPNGPGLKRADYTFSAMDGKTFKQDLASLKPTNKNVRRMHTAVRLNEVIVEKSHDAQLVILNLPGPPKNASGELNYMEYLEVLTEGLERVLMVRGGGREVITIYS